MDACCLLACLAIFLIQARPTCLRRVPLSGLKPPPSITNQEMPNMHAHKPIWGRRLFIWGSFFPGWWTWQQKLSKTIRLWGLCPNQQFNQTQVCSKQNLNKLLKVGRTVKRDLGVEMGYPPVPFPGCHEVMSLCHMHPLTWSLPKTMDSENAELKCRIFEAN